MHKKKYSSASVQKVSGQPKATHAALIHTGVARADFSPEGDARKFEDARVRRQAICRIIRPNEPKAEHSDHDD